MIQHEDNLFLDREPNGDVRILKLAYPPAYPPKSGKPYCDPENVVFDMRVSWQTWCRMMAHVSYLDHVERWYVAKEFHMGSR